MNVRSVALTTGIFGAATMFILPWWLILIGNAKGPVTFFERIYIGYSYTPMGSVIGAAPNIPVVNATDRTFIYFFPY